MSTTGSSSLGPLSVGNVVNAGVRIYRSHLQQYFMLALLASVWLFVPIYGWAKYFAISGQISRLAFQELINQPESNEQSRRHTNPLMWRFLVAALLVGLRLIGIYFLISIAVGVLVGISAALGLGILGGLLAGVAFIVGIVFFIRYYSSLIISEVPLAVEPNLTASDSIRRSSSLTEGSIGRIQWVIVVAFLITLLLQVPLQAVSFALQAAQVASPESALIGFLSLVLLVVSVFCGALLLPFWQVIKAVIYYDLRSRREGLGLELRDRKR